MHSRFSNFAVSVRVVQVFALSSLYAQFSRYDGLSRTTQTRASQWSPSAAASKVRWLGGVATAMVHGRWWYPSTWLLVGRTGSTVLSLFFLISFSFLLPSSVLSDSGCVSIASVQLVSGA